MFGVLDVLSYPVSFLLRLWHNAFGALTGGASGAGWVAAVVALVVTLRLILLRPALSQARSAARLRELQPRIAVLRKRHGHDRQRLVRELQKLHTEHGVSPTGGCAPMLLQLPVLLGLSHLIYSLGRTPSGQGHFVFDAGDVHAFETAHVAGTRLTSALARLGDGMPQLAENLTVPAAVLAFALIAIAAVGGHLNARFAMRHNAAATEPAAQWMQRLMLWGAPAGAVIAGPFLATAILVYWATNTVCTFVQGRVLDRMLIPKEISPRTP